VSAGASLAGFFAAHAIWCVSDGGPLIPILATEFDDGQRQSIRFGDEEIAIGAKMAQLWLESNHFNAQRAVSIVDGYVTLPTGRTDALLLEMRDYGEREHSFSMVIPYRPMDHPDGFAVFRPKFAAFLGARGDEDLQAAVAAFFAGVDLHEEGAKVWNAAIDQSS
jgi:hypothetical protein